MWLTKKEKQEVTEEVNKKELLKDKLNFEDLTPKSDLPSESIYSKSLTWSLEQENIKNIAISGCYGSGKSSILNSYFKDNSKALFISLAQFKLSEDSQKENNNKLNKNLEEEIEKGILKQLIYKLPNKQTPNSSFKVLEKDSTKFKATIILAFIFSLILSIKPLKTLANVIASSSLESYKFSFLSFLILLTLLASSWTILHYVLKYNILKKIKVKNTEIELNKETDSIFDKFLSEIIYFFEVSSYHIVIFEDLDRFDNVEIFVKLREINHILNNNQKIKNKLKPIVFIYAVKDNLFKDDERVKFFDFIIPIVPYINNSNSQEILYQKVKEAGLKEELSLSFIINISLYIDDMRFLINLFNEFLIYSKKLSLIKNYEKLFSMLLFKTKYPKDFYDLEKGKGFLYEILNYDTRKALILKAEEEINQEVEEEEKVYLKRGTLSDLIEDLIENHSQISLLTTLRSKDLLFFLLKEGYLSEDYYEYISLFHGKILTLNDKQFLINVKNRIKSNFNLQVKNLPEMLNYLEDDDYKSREILNFSLINYIQEKSDFISILNLNSIISQFETPNRTNINFLLNLEDQINKESEFLNKVFKNEGSIKAVLLYKDSELTEEQKNKLIFKIIKHVPTAFKHLKSLSLELPELDKVPKELLETIYKNNLYTITKSNLEKIITDLNLDGSILESYKNLTNSHYPELVEYCEKNINDYVSEVLLKQENLIEPEESMLELLNKDIPDNTKVKLISKFSTKFKSIKTIETELHSLIIKENKAEINWNNLLYLLQPTLAPSNFNQLLNSLFYKNIDFAIEVFLQKDENFKELLKSSLEDNEFFGNTILKLFDYIIKNEPLSKEKFSKVLNKFPYYYEKYNYIKDIPNNYLDIIINSSFLGLTKENFESLKENYPSKYLEFLKNKIDVYLKENIEITLTDEEVRELIKLNLSKKQIMQVLKKNNIFESNIPEIKEFLIPPKAN